MPVILVCGDRNWTNEELIRDVLKAHSNPILRWVERLVHGGCKGADEIAGRVGKELGYHVQEFPANWNLHGKSAGPKRNIEMLNHIKGMLRAEVIAFHNDLDNSKGTKHMVSIAKAAGIPVTVIKEGVPWQTKV